jgi:hypothetical protein
MDSGTQLIICKHALACRDWMVDDDALVGSVKRKESNFIIAKNLLLFNQVEEKLESGQGKTSFRRFFSRFCTPIFLEVSTILASFI